MTQLELSRHLEALKLLIFDVDGTLTDGVVEIDDNGVESKHFHIVDGLAFKLAQLSGLKIAVVSARSSPALQHRFSGLPTDFLVQGVSDKGKAVCEIAESHGLSLDRTGFVGDDLNDLLAFAQVGVKIAVANAAKTLKAQADWVTQTAGGFGAAREVIERVLQEQGRLEASVEAYLKDLGQ